ncbi:MAG: 3-dehydroquinate synthase [Actinomycetia bacterium]|nr:3-dehydroquinate synthase [Actinomycetes bacterium]
MWQKTFDVMGQRGEVVVDAGASRSLADRLAGSGLDAAGLVVADERLGDRVGALLEALAARGLRPALHLVRGGEAAKTWDTVAGILGAAVAAGVGRDGWLAAVGGGVVTDVAGFAAAVYLRGVAWAAVPTTLLGQIDAALGGKTGIDLPEGKNLVGAFHLPRWVLVDPGWLATLDRVAWRSGWGELVKTALLVGEDAWAAVCAAPPAWEDPAPALALLETAVRHKVEVVEADPRETGLRATLNLGHTVGHAWEALSGYTVPHGEAVGVGLLAALTLSERMLGLAPHYRRDLLAVLGRWGMPTRLGTWPLDRWWAVLRRDKKRRAGQMRWVLLRRPGEPVVTTVPDSEVGAVLSALGGDG